MRSSRCTAEKYAMRREVTWESARSYWNACPSSLIRATFRELLQACRSNLQKDRIRNLMPLLLRMVRGAFLHSHPFIRTTYGQSLIMFRRNHPLLIFFSPQKVPLKIVLSQVCYIVIYKVNKHIQFWCLQDQQFTYPLIKLSERTNSTTTHKTKEKLWRLVLIK
jgi:hypothetical protein